MDNLLSVDEIVEPLNVPMRCNNCNFWKPCRKTKRRWTWGVCLPRQLEHKWTCECIVFDKNNDQFIREDGIIFNAIDRLTAKSGV